MIWSGDWAVYFRVLLSDEASIPPGLHEIAQTLEREMADRLDFLELGLFDYFHYRSQSEQNKIKEKIWA